MLYGLLLTLFVLIGFFIILFVLIQQSKSSLGLGSIGDTQMLFGGSGGQNFFQKTTWILGGLFMILSFGLAIMKSSYVQTRYIKPSSGTAPVVQEFPTQEAPAQAAESTSEKA
jgi:protein translocase SecG subunit